MSFKETLLSARFVKKHGMKNEKWDIKEKSAQYRSILKLHERDKKLQALNAVKLKKKLSKSIKELKGDCQYYRRIVKDVIYGDKRLIRLVIQNEKDFQILLKDANPEDVWKVVFQDYNNKRKKLDKLLHEKKKIMNQLCVVRSEHTNLEEDLGERLARTPEEKKAQTRKQWLISSIQVALAKNHAGIAIRETYEHILVILKKDSMYFDGVLKAMRDEQREQCKMIYRTTIIGQLAYENLDDMRLKYKKLADEVWINMKERERALETMKKRCADIWEYAKSLVRVESDPNLVKKKSEKILDEDKKLLNEIARLESIFNQMKESLLIRSFEELFVRLEGQMKQKSKLSKMYQDCMKERDIMLNKKNHAELIHNNLEHSMLTTTTSYKSDKKEMLEKIEEEKKREIRNKRSVETQGILLTNVKAALMHLSSILMCVPSAPGKTLELTFEEKKEKTCVDTIELDAATLLQQVLTKASTLYQQTNYTLNEERAEKAKQAYQDYVSEYQSKLRFKPVDEEVQGMMFEHETVDASVLTRADIKQKSKRIVEANMVKEAQ